MKGVATGQSEPVLPVKDFEAALDELVAASQRLPVLAPEVYSREGIRLGPKHVTDSWQ
jgi:hypothetical protein